MAHTSTGHSVGIHRRMTSRLRTTRCAASIRLRTALVTAGQMDEIRGAGVDEIAVSWWRRAHLKTSVARGRRRGSRRRDFGRRAHGAVRGAHGGQHGRRPRLPARFGIRTFYVYRPLDLPIADWAAAEVGAARRRLDGVRADGARRRCGSRGLRRRLHLRHRRVRRRGVRPALRRRTP